MFAAGFFFFNPLVLKRASQVVLVVKNPPAIAEMEEMWVQSLGRENPQEEGMEDWQPTPVFLSGESYGQRSLAGYNPWGHKELDMTEET